MHGKRIRWGIIGTGKIARKFANALAETPDAQLYAVASRSGVKARDFCAELNSVQPYGSYEALLADPAVEVVYVATPHSRHHQDAIACLNAGKAVLCEKPLALNAREVREIRDTAQHKGLFLMEAIWTCFHPNILKAQQLIAEGKIGELKYLRADFGFLTPYAPQSRLFNLELGGGALLDIGIYPLFLAQLLLGPPVEMQVLGTLAPGGADALCHVLSRHKGGQTAHLHASFVADTNIEAEIYGTEGRIVLHSRWHNPGPLSLWQRQELIESFPFPRDNGYTYEIAEVQRCLRLGLTESPMLPLSFSLTLAQWMDEIRARLGVIYPADAG